MTNTVICPAVAKKECPNLDCHHAKPHPYKLIEGCMGGRCDYVMEIEGVKEKRTLYTRRCA